MEKFSEPEITDYNFNVDEYYENFESEIIKDPSKIETLDKKSSSYSFMYFYYNILTNSPGSILDLNKFDVKIFDEKTISLLEKRIGTISEFFENDILFFFINNFKFNDFKIIEVMIEYFFEKSQSKESNSSQVLKTILEFYVNHINTDFSKVEKYFQNEYVLESFCTIENSWVRKDRGFIQRVLEHGKNTFCTYIKNFNIFTKKENVIVKESEEVFYEILKNIDVDILVKNAKALCQNQYFPILEKLCLFDQKMEEKNFNDLFDLKICYDTVCNNILENFVDKRFIRASTFYTSFFNAGPFRFFIKNGNEFVLKPFFNEDDGNLFINMIKTNENVDVISDFEKYQNFQEKIKNRFAIYDIRDKSIEEFMLIDKDTRINNFLSSQMKKVIEYGNKVLTHGNKTSANIDLVNSFIKKIEMENRTKMREIEKENTREAELRLLKNYSNQICDFFGIFNFSFKIENS